ncbi:MAG: hypothetical protein DME25_20910 [Verrucomicrobia bacterium]|nr:MAG: hypothetical protein DME25_20910 [Verrucomicrobiota bacterium]
MEEDRIGPIPQKRNRVVGQDGAVGGAGIAQQRFPIRRDPVGHADHIEIVVRGVAGAADVDDAGQAWPE